MFFSTKPKQSIEVDQFCYTMIARLLEYAKTDIGKADPEGELIEVQRTKIYHELLTFLLFIGFMSFIKLYEQGKVASLRKVSPSEIAAKLGDSFWPQLGAFYEAEGKQGTKFQDLFEAVGEYFPAIEVLDRQDTNKKDDFFYSQIVFTHRAFIPMQSPEIESLIFGIAEQLCGQARKNIKELAGSYAIN